MEICHNVKDMEATVEAMAQALENSCNNREIASMIRSSLLQPAVANLAPLSPAAEIAEGEQ